MKFGVAGAGYVGLANAIMFARKYETIILDIDNTKVDKINNSESTIKDDLATQYLSTYELQLKATNKIHDGLKGCDLIFIATPTDYDQDINHFDTESVERVIEESINTNPESLIVIKSTVPIGFTNKMRIKYKTNRIVFSPEFLREGNALFDCMHPSRVIIGDKSEIGIELANIFKNVLDAEDVNFIHTDSNEAESIKLFANSYLAMRVSFFNELDSFSEIEGLNSKEIINGICSDPRIGFYYNNPSFGYGGYCLPKDTRQLSRDMSKGINKVINATIESNEDRIQFITQQIINKKQKRIGIYKLAMKSGSDNYRSSSILPIIESLKKSHELTIYDPSVSEQEIFGVKVENDFHLFCENSELIVCNRFERKLEEYKFKVYTRDLFEKDT